MVRRVEKSLFDYLDDASAAKSAISAAKNRADEVDALRRLLVAAVGIARMSRELKNMSPEKREEFNRKLALLD